MVLGSDSLIEIKVGKVFGWHNRLGNLVVIKYDPPALLLDVTDIVTTHCGRTHVTDEGNELIF